MKTRWIQLIAGLTMFALCISVCTTTANAAVVWQDDFSDPNLPGWTIYGYTDRESPVKIEGNFSAADGTLKVLDDGINIARHNSTTDVGTWYFDMFVPDDDYGAFYVDFMSNGSALYALGNASCVSVGPYLSEHKFYISTMNASNVGSVYQPLKSIDVDPLQGWHHIAVRRTSDCRFLVALNRTLVANVTSYAVTSSIYLQVYCINVTGAAIDNLVVDDDPDEFWNHVNSTGGNGVIDWPPIIIGVVVAVAVIAIVIVFLRRR
jgi:hypothetical protein